MIRPWFARGHFRVIFFCLCRINLSAFHPVHSDVLSIGFNVILLVKLVQLGTAQELFLDLYFVSKRVYYHFFLKAEKGKDRFLAYGRGDVARKLLIIRNSIKNQDHETAIRFLYLVYLLTKSDLSLARGDVQPRRMLKKSSVRLSL